MTGKVHWRQIEEISESALERPPGDREAFLREACGGDEEVRHEIEAVLANIARAEMFLEQPVAAVAAQVLETSTDAVLTGGRLNALAMGPLIGIGGMGQVYRARDSELDRDVAVKVLLPEFARDADRVARFAREARVLATLNHPNIAQIHGFEKSDAATAIIMELVEGETLTQRIARGPSAMSEMLSIARQIAEALEAAHDQGVIHRDLKPANIKVRPDGTVKVLDFGLAKSVQHAASEGDECMKSGDPSTIPGMMLGTIAYMAPEQARQKPVDRRVDIWALGCVMFEMLTGQPAFTGETPSDVLVKIIEGGTAGNHAAGDSAIADSMSGEERQASNRFRGGGPSRDRRRREGAGIRRGDRRPRCLSDVPLASGGMGGGWRARRRDGHRRCASTTVRASTAAVSHLFHHR